MSRTPVKWAAPPSSGRLKLNFNGAWNMDRDVGGVGTIICDELGNFVATFCTNFSNVSSLLYAKHLQREHLWFRRRLGF